MCLWNEKLLSVLPWLNMEPDGQDRSLNLVPDCSAITEGVCLCAGRVAYVCVQEGMGGTWRSRACSRRQFGAPTLLAGRCLPHPPPSHPTAPPPPPLPRPARPHAQPQAEMNTAYAWHDGVADFLRPCLAWLQSGGAADLRYLASRLAVSNLAELTMEREYPEALPPAPPMPPPPPG